MREETALFTDVSCNSPSPTWGWNREIRNFADVIPVLTMIAVDLLSTFAPRLAACARRELCLVSCCVRSATQNHCLIKGAAQVRLHEQVQDSESCSMMELRTTTFSQDPSLLVQTGQRIGESLRSGGASQHSPMFCSVDPAIGLTCMEVAGSSRRSECETPKSLKNEKR